MTERVSRRSLLRSLAVIGASIALAPTAAQAQIGATPGLAFQQQPADLAQDAPSPSDAPASQGDNPPPASKSVVQPQEGTIIFQDNFSNQESGFPKSSRQPDQWAVGYDLGLSKYFVTMFPSGVPNVIEAPRLTGDDQTDFDAQVDAALVESGSDNGAVLLGFRNNGPGFGYRLSVRPNIKKFTFIAQHGTGVSDFDRPIELTDSSAINTGSEFNTIRALTKGNFRKLFINGQQVGEVTDSRYGKGKIALGVGGPPNGQYKGLFGNLVVKGN